MQAACRSAFIPVLLTCAVSLAAAQKSDFRFTVAPGATVSITNEYGPIDVTSVSGNAVLATATPQSSNAKVSATQAGNRIEIHTHLAQPSEQTPVSYRVQVPASLAVVIRTSLGHVTVENTDGGLSVESDTGAIDIHHAQNAAIDVRTLEGPVSIRDVIGNKVAVETVSSTVTLENVASRSVTVQTSSGAIRFSGVPGDESQCQFASHSGDIVVALDPNASVDITATSENGSVQDSFQLQPDPHPATALVPGKSLAGRANSGGAKMHLSTFSGKITVTKK